ncbi:MAG: pyruvate kinase [Rickettsiales bacterium]|jgi:pyruvate kinase|nr:pyruvate kinase [Rickettsiales bacterium]
MRFTKITASIGPASESPEMIDALAAAGANAFRLNFSHDSGDVQGTRIKRIRRLKTPAAIIADLQGPKHRIGDFAGGSATLREGSEFAFDDNPKDGDDTRVHMPDGGVLAALAPGGSILLNDGRQELKVVKAGEGKALTIVVRGGTIASRRGFNLPDTEIVRPILTGKDRADLEYALARGVDYVAVSFVQRPEDISEVRDFITERTDRPVKIIAKIERPQALERIEDIIENSDGIMIARGDLAVEVPYYKVPEISRRLIRLCRGLNKPIIMATQMLGSMVDSEFPTRAEISDVATAAYLRADSAMTSEETTVGRHPAATMETMAAILGNADGDEVYNRFDWTPERDAKNAWSKSVVELARLNDAAAIVIFTHTGENARTISSRRPDVPIVAVCGDDMVANQLCLYRGVIPLCDRKLFREKDFDAAAAAAGINSGRAVVVDKDSIALGHI